MTTFGWIMLGVGLLSVALTILCGWMDRRNVEREFLEGLRRDPMVDKRKEESQ